MLLGVQVACDGGKDSLSMAASAGGETVMAPGNLVISAYVTCPDITKTVTPDMKLPGSGKLIHVDLAQGQNRRLGGSCLGQVIPIQRLSMMLDCSGMKLVPTGEVDSDRQGPFLLDH